MAVYNAAASRSQFRSSLDHQLYSASPFAVADRRWNTARHQQPDCGGLHQLLVPTDGNMHRSNARTNGSAGMCSIFQRAREQVRKTAERCKAVSPALKWIQATSKALFLENSASNSCLPLLNAGFEDMGAKLARIVPTGRGTTRGADPELDAKPAADGVLDDPDLDMKPLIPTSRIINDDHLNVGRNFYHQKCRKSGDQSVLLKIAVVDTRKTLLLLAPAEATAQAVIQMILSWDARRHGITSNKTSPCAQFDLYCAHRCRSRPALHPKQPIGMAGSRYLFLCRRPQSFVESTSLADQRVVRLPQISSSKRNRRRAMSKKLASILQNCWATMSNTTTSVNNLSCFANLHHHHQTTA